MTFLLGYLAGVLSTLVLVAFFAGAFRQTPAEQARALGWHGYEEHA